jgi:hypothetical protein
VSARPNFSLWAEFGQSHVVTSSVELKNNWNVVKTMVEKVKEK